MSTNDDSTRGIRSVQSIARRTAIARRVDALFKAMSTDFLLREQFVTEPSQILSEYIHGQKLPAETAEVRDQVLYSVLATPALVAWLYAYVARSSGVLPQRERFVPDFSRAVTTTGAHHVIIALARASVEKIDVFGDDGPLAVMFDMFADASRLGSRMAVTEMSTGHTTGTEMSTGHTVASRLAVTEMSTGHTTGTEMSTGHTVASRLGSRLAATEMSTGHTTGTEMSTGHTVASRLAATEMSTGHTTGTEMSTGHTVASALGSRLAATEMSTGHTTGTEMSTGHTVASALGSRLAATEMSTGHTTGTEMSTGHTVADELFPTGVRRVTLSALVDHANLLRDRGALDVVWAR
jgi:hypothetical protein